MPHIVVLILAAVLLAGMPAHADPISAGITAVVGVFAAGGSIASTVGSFLVNTALSVGLSFVARALTPKKQSGASASNSKLTLQMQIDADKSRVLVLGARAVGGSLHYFQKSGPQNENIDLIIALADHECQSLEMCWVNGRAIAMHLNEHGYQDVPEFSDKYGIPMLSFRFYRGTADQLADPDTVASSGGAWTEGHRLAGICYMHVRVVFNPDVWGNAMPTFRWLLRGAKMYDPRRDSTLPGGLGPHRWGVPSTYEFTDNLEICRYNYLRGIYNNGDRWFGVGLSNDQINLAQTMASINACEELIELRTGGYEPRYRVAAVIEADEDHRAVLNRFAMACAGNMPDLSGKYSLRPGVAEIPVAFFTDADLVASADLVRSRYRSLGEVVNEVTGTWADPDALYELTSVPTRYSSADEALDGNYRRSQPYDLSYVASQSQGQRCLEIFRRLARRQASHTSTLKRKFAYVEAGDWVVWSSEKFGYVEKVFRVEAATLLGNWTNTLQMREIDADVYAWTKADELDPANPQDLPSGGAGSNVITGVAIALAQVNGIDGTQMPGIRVTWDPISDPTVYGLVIEYRRVGDAPWQTYVANETEARNGAATITAGIIGNDFYQARVTPLVSPRRIIGTSGIVTTTSSTVQVVVNRALVAVVAEGVQPGRVTNDMLDGVVRDKFDQARRDNDALTIALMAERADTEAANEIQTRATNALRADVAQGLNAATASITHLENVVVGVEESVAELSVELNAEIAGVAANLVVEQNTRASADGALAEQITDLTAQVGTDIAGIHVELEAQASATAVVASETRTLFAQDLQATDAATIALMAEMSARDEDTTDLRRGLNASFAGISEVRKAAVENGEAIALVSTTLAAEVNGLTAIITQESIARSDGDEAVASHAETLIAQESADRGAAVSAEALARTNADGVLASNITSAVATETSNRNAAVTAEQTARINADNALASSITTVQATANFATASGQYGVVASAGVGGAVASFQIALNAGAIGAGMRLDAMSGGTSRVVFNVGAFYIEDPGAGVRSQIFSYSGGNFLLGGNVRINGNLLVTGTITSTEISEAAGISALHSTGGAIDILGTASGDWVDVGSPIGVNVATRGGFTAGIIFLKASATATNTSSSAAAVASAEVRVLDNNNQVYYSGLFNLAIPPSGSRGETNNDFIDGAGAGGAHTYRVQVRYAYSGTVNGNIFAKIGLITVNR